MKLVRQAIYHAIDRRLIVDKVLDGYAVPLNGPLQTFCLGYDPSAPGTTLTSRPGPRSCWPRPPRERPVARVQRRDERLHQGQGRRPGDRGDAEGRRHHRRDEDAGERQLQLRRRGRKYGFYFTGRGNTRDPSAALTQFFRTGASKRVGYSDPEFDKLLDAQQVTSNQDERAKLFSQAVRVLMEDAPAVFLYNYKDVYGVANQIDFQPWSNEYVHAYLFKFKG